MSESRSRHPSTAISDPIVRVILSESLCPSRFIKVALSESLYPSRFIRVASSESFRSRGGTFLPPDLANSAAHLPPPGIRAIYPSYCRVTSESFIRVPSLTTGPFRLRRFSQKSSCRDLSKAGYTLHCVRVTLSESLRLSHSVRVNVSELCCPSHLVRVMLSHSI